MNTVLFIEDEATKCKLITEFIKENIPELSVTNKRSYQSGLRELLSNKYDLVLLDMTLPTYDINNDEPGGPILLNGGLSLLSEMKRRRIDNKVIVVTQYEAFGTGSEMTTLDELKSKIELFNTIYIGTVFYNPSTSSWKEELLNLIKVGGIPC